MPLDAIFLSALCAELAPALDGARIDKIQQPARDLLLFSLHTREGNRRLLISGSVGSARVHFTAERYENPDSPPMFCMLLRKHLGGARISGISQPPGERLLMLDMDTRDELGRESRRRLIVELIGRASNVILTDADGIIIDCLRRADFGETAYRRLIPGMRYRLPPLPKAPNLLELDPEDRRELILEAPGELSPEAVLLERFSGLSPLIARELAYCAGEREYLPDICDALAEGVDAGAMRPYLIIVNGEARDFTFIHIMQYGQAAKCEEFCDFSTLLDTFYARRDRAERMRRISQDTMKTLRTLRDRQARKLAMQRAELNKTAEREEQRRRGELITANLWRLKRGDRTLVCEDFYAEGCPEVTIRLDPLKTPQQNAAAAYKAYKKAAAAERHLTQLIADGERLLDYLESVIDALSRAESERDVEEIRRELQASGVLPTPKSRQKQKIKPRGPLRFVSSAGLEILAGRSNAQNDELTTKIARRSDIWLHVQHVHGSHVILRTQGEAPDEQSLNEAASIAVYCSQARDSGKTAVDYTLVKNVKKPSSALPGKVIYTDYKTLIAAPDEQLISRLKCDM